MFQTPCVFDVGQSRQHALQVLQAAVVHVAGNHVSDSSAPSDSSSSTSGGGGELMVLMNRSHTRMYGFCIVGKITVHFPEEGPVGAKIISQLEMLGKAVRRLLVSPATTSSSSPYNNNNNTSTNNGGGNVSTSSSTSSSMQAVNGTIPSLAYVSDLIIDNLNTVHTLSSTDMTSTSSASASQDQSKHWCSLSCTHCAHEQCESEA